MISIISSPKSGRTWLKFILGKYHCLANRLPDDQILSSAIEGYQFSHDVGGFDNARPKHVNTSKYIVFLKRNVYDVVVSSYYHVKYRDKCFDGTISEYIQSEFSPVQKWKIMCDKWEPLADKVITYENLQENTFSTVCDVLEGWQKPIRGDLLLKAIDYADFDNMKQIEKSGTFSDTESMKSVDNSNGMKVRNGKVGGYSEVLSDKHIMLIDSIV